MAGACRDRRAPGACDTTAWLAATPVGSRIRISTVVGSSGAQPQRVEGEIELAGADGDQLGADQQDPRDHGRPRTTPVNAESILWTALDGLRS